MTTPKPDKHFRLPVAKGFRVDRTQGRLFDVALIVGDREAKGHGIYIDQITIDGAGASVAARGGRLKAAIRHPSMEDYMSNGGDRLLELPGFFDTVSVRGNQLVGDVEFYDSFKTKHADDFNHLLEVAEKTPELIGLSVEMWGFAVFVAEDGTEYSERPKDIPLKYAGLPAFRVTDLMAAAFVDEPAATDGLFAKFSRLFGGKQSELSTLRTFVQAFLAWSSEESGAVALGCTPDRTGIRDENAFAAAPIGNSSASALLSTPPDPIMQILASLKQKFGADKARFARALELLADESTLTVEGIEAKLAAADFTALQNSVTSLTAEIATHKESHAEMVKFNQTVAAERDEWKAKFQALKTSGLDGRGLDLGAGAVGGDASTQVNPWKKESLNYTHQAELAKTQPALAAQLKAAAGVN